MRSNTELCTSSAATDHAATMTPTISLTPRTQALTVLWRADSRSADLFRMRGTSSLVLVATGGGMGHQSWVHMVTTQHITTSTQLCSGWHMGNVSSSSSKQELFVPHSLQLNTGTENTPQLKKNFRVLAI